jgi:hypothetical protein
VIIRKAQNAHILPVAAALWNPAHASQVTQRSMLQQR